jgi:hypothetical protein
MKPLMLLMLSDNDCAFFITIEYIMGKKCIPGLFCIENMTLFVLVILAVIGIYLFFRNGFPSSENKIVIVSSPSPPPSINRSMVSVLKTPIEDPYYPPLQSNIFPIPPSIATRGFDTDFQQIGILTDSSSSSGRGNNIILPLMGRSYVNGRDKYQYYTISATGSLTTKLPIRFRGKSGMTEYGCDEIFNGDEVFVDGYNSRFVATLYETGAFRYM